MQQIKCPHCGEVFQVDESGYQNIAKQIRDQEFEKELKKRQQELNERQEQEAELRLLQLQKAHEDTIAKQKTEIAKLTEQLKNSDDKKQLAVNEALQRQQQALNEKNAQIQDLQGQLKTKAVESQLQEKSLTEQFNRQLQQKDEEIAYYKDLKQRQSTKIVGETLEQHCEIQFNQLRMAAFPKAYFEKDNDARQGSKGDYIFRERDENGVEFISIMFEMKNEMDETATKHKNEDFFAKLDKDRREKKCEYAVLVSLLERNNELYNDGIVDVSYRYEKMYVIRPQFFIPLITLLRNAARNSLKYRQELAVVKSQQIDIQNFEANMEEFKEKFGRNFRLASERFQTAIDEIDKTIDHLQKTKAALLSSENNLRLANDKAESLSIKRLTKNAPSVKAMFDAQREE